MPLRATSRVARVDRSAARRLSWTTSPSRIEATTSPIAIDRTRETPARLSRLPCRSQGRKTVLSLALRLAMICSLNELVHRDEGHQDRERDEPDARPHEHDDQRL